MKLQEKFATENTELQEVILAFASGVKEITTLFHPDSRKDAGTVNASGHIQLQMDITADNLFLSVFKEKNCIRSYASEEREEIIKVNPNASYSVTIDPLDGSSLLDANLSVGSILGIWEGDIFAGTLACAAYAIYGPTTVLVLSTGKGVHEFMLQGDDFICTKENICMKDKGNIYSIGGLKSKWLTQHAAFISELEDIGYKLRYSGALVADVHQILTKNGGIFTYPALTDAPNGKLHMFFELAPLAYIVEQALGSATNGTQRILELQRKVLNQKSPIYIGSRYEVEKAKRILESKKTTEYRGDYMTTTQQTKESSIQQSIQPKKVFVPADVPSGQTQIYIQNYFTATKNTGRLFLFAGDQKIEHLNEDFYGTFDEGIIPIDDAEPEHLFRIAQQAKQYIGVFAAQYGLIARYGRTYNDIPFLVKMNSKSHLVKTKQSEPISTQLVSFEDVLELQKNSGLNIVGVGYTVYAGSTFESDMLAEAGRLVAAAHRHGMLVVLWMYPRGAAVPDEKDPHIIAGAAGVACCLGADFAKVNYPNISNEVRNGLGSSASKSKEGAVSEEIFKEAILAAGRTGVITSGGSSTDVRKFLERLHKQIHISGAVGNATGRNIHQKPLQDAIRMCAAIASITYGNKEPDFAMAVYEGREVF